jgi:hypothetical protein
MTDIQHRRQSLMQRVLEGEGAASRALRRAAFDHSRASLAEPLAKLIEKVAVQANSIVEEDIAAVRSLGFTEDQLFEIMVCAAVGEATRQYESGRAALDAATRKS